MDSRLGPDVLAGLQTHLQACPSCQNWNEEQLWLREQTKAPEMMQASPAFFVKIQNKIAESAVRPRWFAIDPTAFRPAMLRTAMLFILIFSALLGFFLGNSLDAPAPETAAAVFSQTMNLNAYADMPAESFGAVYERLLQGELQ
jgi:hypothetical protein